MFCHLSLDSIKVLEEAHMTELVDLIMADKLYVHLFLHIFDIRLGCSDRGDSGSRECDLRCGTDLIYHIRISGLRALRKDIKDMIRMIRV